MGTGKVHGGQDSKLKVTVVIQAGSGERKPMQYK